MTGSTSALIPDFRVPDDLTERDQWVLWRYEDRNGKAAPCPLPRLLAERALPGPVPGYIVGVSGGKDSVATTLPPDLLITVCDACLQASCWQAKFLCENARSAGTVDLLVKRPLKLNREHPNYWLADPRAEAYRKDGL